MTELVSLDALGPAGEFRARRRIPIADVRGEPVAELGLVPDLFVTRSIAALRTAPTMPADDRAAALITAAELFEAAEINGLIVTEHARAVSRVSGLPISVVRASTSRIADRLRLAYDSAQHARPAAAVADWRHPGTRTGAAVWTRRGDVFAVHAPGNHPGAHSIWPEALALGYRVAVRPSQREPFTAYRLVSALRQAGFSPDSVVLLPTGHDGTDRLLEAADVAMVYGGDEVLGKYRGRRTVLPQGPGRSKIVVTADVNWRDHLHTIAESVAAHGGTGCVNTTAVLVEDSPEALAEALADRLSWLPSAPPDDDKAVLPVLPVAQARAVAQRLAVRAAGTRPWLGANRVVDDLDDGSAALRPAVHEVARPDSPQLAAEFPFPCVWVGPWERGSGIAPLRDSLVVTAMTGDEQLIDSLMEEPTIANVYVGDQPTFRMAHGVPHDSYLADFLMRCKGVFRG